MNRQYGALSGVAIFLIVLNHAVHFGFQVAPVGRPWSAVLIVLQALGTFAVPVFLFVSGAFLAYAAREFSVTFVRSSLERILWPYVIWSSIFYLLLYVSSGVIEPARAYLRHLLVGYPFHFVPLLVFWYLATPAVAWMGRRRPGGLLAAIAIGQAWLIAVRDPGMVGLQGWMPAWAGATAPPVLANTLADWGVFFPLGFVMSVHGATLRPRLLAWRVPALATAAGVFALGLLNAAGVVPAPWARLVAPVPLMFVLPTVDRMSIPLLSWWERLGRRSYGIYLTHFVVLTATVQWLGGRAGGVPWLVYPGLLVLGVGVSLTIMDVSARTAAGRKAYRYLFGIVPPPPDRRPA